MPRDTRPGDDGTVVYHDGLWDILYCGRCGCAVGQADPLKRAWGMSNGRPMHEGCASSGGGVSTDDRRE